MNKWRSYRLDNIGSIITGSTPSTNIKKYWNGDFPFYSPADFTGSVYCYRTEKTITGESLKISRPIPKKGIMFACIASIGKVAISGLPGITNQQINTIIPFGDFDYRYIYYTLLFNSYKFVNYAPQTTIPIVNKTDFGKFSFSLPPLPHQRKISRILTTVDNIIEKTESTIEKYKAMKQGMMHDLFTRGIDVKTGKLRPCFEDAPELYKEIELGMVPKEWEVKRLEEFVYMKSGDGITSESIEVMGDYPVYGGNGLRGYAKNNTHSGDFVLIGRQGALCGNVFRVRGKFFASEHAVVVTILDSSNVDWLSQKLKFMKLNKYSEASAQPGLAVSKLLSLSVSLPKENEQKEVAKRILILNSKLQTEQTTLSKYQKLKQGLMQDLLTGQKEVTPDPEDFKRE